MAKIIEFPKSRRVDRRAAERGGPVAAAPTPAPRVDWDGWYHAAAIEESRRARSKP